MLVKVMIQVQQGITSPVCTRTSDAFVILTSLSEAPLQCCGLIMRRLLWWTGKHQFRKRVNVLITFLFVLEGTWLLLVEQTWLISVGMMKNTASWTKKGLSIQASFESYSLLLYYLSSYILYQGTNTVNQRRHCSNLFDTSSSRRKERSLRMKMMK